MTVKIPPWYYDWERKFEEYRKEMEEKESERTERLKKKESLENSWKLLRLCRSYIEENSNTWRNEEEERERKRKQDEMRNERLLRAGKKQEDLRKNMLQKKITESMKRLPKSEQEQMRINEEKAKRLELQEAKKNLWRKKWKNWRKVGKEDWREG